MPSIGNRAYEMKVHGHNILYFSGSDLAQYEKRPAMEGVPFLAPWGNRLDESAVWANGKKYLLNPGLGNLQLIPLPIHGLLVLSLIHI